MTRKDYIKLAAFVRKLAANEAIPAQIVLTTVHELCDILAEENPRFDRGNFLTAAGIIEKNNG